MAGRQNRLLVVVFACAAILVVFSPRLHASEDSQYATARQCVEWSLSSDDFFAFFDTITMDSIKERLANNVRFRGYEQIVAQIHQQATRDFLTQNGALESTWDKAARNLMSEFSESELLLVRDYQTRETGKDFLETKVGKKWKDRAETIVRAAFEDGRRNVFEGSRYEVYKKAVEQKIAQAEAEGKIPMPLFGRTPRPWN